CSSWSSTVTGSDAALSAAAVLAAWVVITSLFSVAGLTVMELLIADVTPVWVVSLAVMVYGEPAVELICSPLKLAAPLAATTEVVPAAKLCEDRAEERRAGDGGGAGGAGLVSCGSTVSRGDAWRRARRVAARVEAGSG